MAKISKGQNFGKWTTIKTIRHKRDSGKYITKWIAKCECGNICSVNGYDLNKGKTTQCRECCRSMPKNLLGKVFGEWTVLYEGEKKNGKTYWICRCSCGNEVNVCSASLLNGVSTRCLKCYQKTMPIHGYKCKDNKHPLYDIWMGMLARCEHENNNSYKNYGNRGITVCERWHSLENFTEDVGSRPDGYSIDRIDNNKGYYKENCKWANQIEQMRNTRRTVFLTYNNETRCLTEWAEFFKIKADTLRKYLKRNTFNRAYKHYTD